MVDLRSGKDLTTFLFVLANRAIDLREAGATDDQAQKQVLAEDSIFEKQNATDKDQIKRLLEMAVKQLESTSRRVRVKHEPREAVASGRIHPKGPTAFGRDVRKSNGLLAEQEARDLTQEDA